MTGSSTPAEMEISRMDATELTSSGPPGSRPPESARISESFTIATPVVTNTSRIEDSLNESSFLHSAGSFHPTSGQFISQFVHGDPLAQAASGAPKAEPTESISAKASAIEIDKETGASSQENTDVGSREHSQPEAGEGSASNLSNEPAATAAGAAATPAKKKKGVRKGAKLDTKSKLEKSRQSARECRARKKLRYQYLEDLVSNREKAVVKLKEELSMFCEMSRKIDDGTISDKERHLLVEQTKENNRT